MKWLLVLLALSGCNGVGEQIPGDGTFVVVSFDAEFYRHYFPGTGIPESVAVRQGIQFWNQLGASLTAPEDAPAGVFYPSYNVQRSTYSWPGEQVDGVTWPCLGYLSIYPNAMKEDGSYDFADFREVVAHEIGHAIGLYHVAGNAVMNPTATWPSNATYPSPADETEYCRIYPAMPICLNR